MEEGLVSSVDSGAGKCFVFCESRSIHSVTVRRSEIASRLRGLWGNIQ